MKVILEPQGTVGGGVADADGAALGLAVALTLVSSAAA